ncbi:hypothetical protein [Vibrio mimicus]|uniref:hypothetical protein n=1 Tax=Vibrio mimicus TaxID=674 RepID=UPI002FF2CDA7
MKRILVISTDWSGLVTPIVSEIRDQGNEVDYIDHGLLSNFQYYGLFNKLQSKINNVLSDYSYKKKRTEEQITCTLLGFFHCREKYDAIIFTNPDIFNDDHFTIFREHASKLILNLWDSLERMPRNIKVIDKFDVVLSFEPLDCDKYGLVSITNYIPPSESKITNEGDYEYDVFSVMSFCKVRYKKLLRFLDENPHIKSKNLVYIDNERKKKLIKDKRVTLINKPIFNEELKSYVKKSRSILDVGYDNQKGLSFRIFESLAWEKKIITTNEFVKCFDFYNYHNIFCVNSISYSVSSDFFSSDYQSIPSEVIDAYRLKNWVIRLMSYIK